MSSKKQFRSQASSGRAAGGFGAFSSSAFTSTDSSALSYVQEAPDYAAINDVNLVVAFKNLSKKDSTTKAKALEDIQTHVNQPEVEIEDGVLGAWVNLFPRLSIDSARRVRQLAHVTNGIVCSTSGKRTAKHLPKIAGPWLAGCYDNDRAAAKAASDAFKAVFASTEKVLGLKKTFHGVILAYCRDAVLNETVQTLSDERTVTRDDAAATYGRVVATSLAVVADLLEQLPPEEIAKQEQLYAEVLGQPKVWEFACHSDVGVRRSTHRLMQTSLVKQPILVESNRKLISTVYIYKGLVSDQTGSATDYVKTLNALSARLPTLWTDDYSGKKSAASRLKQFLKHGSRSGSRDFWVAAAALFHAIPASVLPDENGEVKDLLIAARDGVSRREERLSASAAWPAYFTLLSILVGKVSEDLRDQILAECALPVVEEFLYPSPDTADWAIHGAGTVHLLAPVLKFPGMSALLKQEWHKYAERVVDTAKTSQPQQSKDFEKSQGNVASAGSRLASLQLTLYTTGVPETLGAVFLASDMMVARECTRLLKSREGKPYGAAAILHEQVTSGGTRLLQNLDFREMLEGFLTADNFQWLFWSPPTTSRLVQCLYLLRSDQVFASLWKGALTAVLNQGGSIEAVCELIQELLPLNTPGEAVALAKSSSELQAFVDNAVMASVTGVQARMLWQLKRIGVLTEATYDKIVLTVTNALASTHDTQDLRDLVHFCTEFDGATLQDMATRPGGDQLLPSLINLEQHEDESIVKDATYLLSRLSASDDRQASTGARFNVILQNLESVSSRSLSMDALRDLTDRIVGEEHSVPDIALALPSLDVWNSSLLAAVRPPKPSLAILSPLGGATHLVQTSSATESTQVQIDSDGLSQALRVAMHVSRLLAETDIKKQLAEHEDQWTVVALLYVSVLLAEDNLS
ncbi:hypothetical protein LTR53_009128, partial [Teratosphaeriaceae sp. CCFEE 6253]